MLVNLIYFKKSGKYYSEGSYQTNKKNLHEIWGEVKDMIVRKELPGLSPGYSEFHVLVDVPEHYCRHPRLVMAF